MAAIGAVGPVSVNPVQLSGAHSPSAAGGGFATLLGDAVRQIAQSQAVANQEIAQAMAGQASVTQVMVALSQAQMSLDVGVSIRNGAVQAYQSIMNMPIG
jgi:flagellar hook-basal body complex protein FliE